VPHFVHQNIVMMEIMHPSMVVSHISIKHLCSVLTS